MKKNSRLTDTKMKYFDILDSYGKDDNMFPPPTDAQLAVNLLCQYLLGEDYYVNDPVSAAKEVLITNYKMSNIVTNKSNKKLF